MKFGSTKTLILVALLTVSGYSTVNAQKSRAVTKPKPIVVVSDGGTCFCVTDRDPNKPLPTTVSGGILNGKAIELPKPDAVRNDQGRSLRGMISVQVLVGEDGTVTSAHGVSGDERLRPAAEVAAMRAKFKPTTLDKTHLVKVSGIIQYKF